MIDPIAQAKAFLATVGAPEVPSTFKPVLPDNFAPPCPCSTCQGEEEAAREEAGDLACNLEACYRARIAKLEYQISILERQFDEMKGIAEAWQNKFNQAMRLAGGNDGGRTF